MRRRLAEGEKEVRGGGGPGQGGDDIAVWEDVLAQHLFEELIGSLHITLVREAVKHNAWRGGGEGR